MKKKMIISTLTVILTINLIITLISINSIKSNYVNEKTKELKILVQTMAISLDSNYQNIDEYIFYLNQRNIRTTIVSSNGDVVYETNKGVGEMQNHLKRKEIQEALSGKVGTDIRFSNTMRTNFLYVAASITDGDGYIIRFSIPLDAIDVETTEIVKKIIIIISIGVCIAVLIILKIMNYFTRPVEELSKATVDIANHKIPKELSYSSNDEIGHLYKNFNEMTKKLDNTIFELENTNLFLNSILTNMNSGVIAMNYNKEISFINDKGKEILDINDYENCVSLIKIIRNYEINTFINEYFKDRSKSKTEIKYKDKVIKLVINILPCNEINNSSQIKYGAVLLIEDITEASKLEEMRKSFVANVTHELKTPLTSIKGFVETIKNNNITDKTKIDRFMSIIDMETDRLKSLIDDILMLSEVETVGGNYTNFDVNEVLEEVKDIMQGLSEKNSININYICDNSIIVYLDRNRLKQLLINLIDNSIKYNNENGSVSVNIAKKDNNLVICVEDTGIGIEESQISRIFERFYRVDKSRSREMGGTGLGLAIVKHIVISFNGEISVKSKLGEGTKININIPLKNI